MFATPSALGGFVQRGGSARLRNGRRRSMRAAEWAWTALARASAQVWRGDMLNSRATTSMGALCGGDNLATALSLNACPHLATAVFPYRPWIEGVGVALWRRQLL